MWKWRRVYISDVGLQKVLFSLTNTIGLYGIWLFHIRPEPDLAGFRNSNPAGAGAGSGFGGNLSWDHRTIRLMKLMAPTMLSAAIKSQRNSVLPLLGHCSPAFDEICVTAMNFVFLSSEHKIRIANTPLDRSAALFFSVINWTYCSCTVSANNQIRLEIWPEPDLAEFSKNGRIPDLPELEPKSGTTLNNTSAKFTQNPLIILIQGGVTARYSYGPIIVNGRGP